MTFLWGFVKGAFLSCLNAPLTQTTDSVFCPLADINKKTFASKKIGLSEIVSIFASEINNNTIMRQLKSTPTEFQWLSRLNYFYNHRDTILEGSRQFFKDSLNFAYLLVLETITTDVYVSCDTFFIYQSVFLYTDAANRNYRKEVLFTFLTDYLKVSSNSFTIVNSDIDKTLTLQLFVSKLDNVHNTYTNTK